MKSFKIEYDERTNNLHMECDNINWTPKSTGKQVVAYVDAFLEACNNKPSETTLFTENKLKRGEI